MPASTTPAAVALRKAATAAVLAPSIFNTQPWRWQVTGDALRLWADHTRQLLIADPDGRMLTISCGITLHHVRVALTAAGQHTEVQLLPDSGDPDLLAQISIHSPSVPTADDTALYDAIARRRTDRRAFTQQTVADQHRTSLIKAAEAAGAHLHLIQVDQIAELSSTAAQAATIQLTNPDHRQELINWTHRPARHTNGVPTTTTVEQSPRPVAVRDFAPFGRPAATAGPDTDSGALFAIVFTNTDEPTDWIQAGTALSAVLLTATSLGLATAPISDITELTITRQRLHAMLSGIGMPQIAARIGHPTPGQPPPATPRRTPTEVIYP